jgi:hypothetical protein
LPIATVTGVMRKHHRQLERQPLGRQDHAISPSASEPIVT